MVNLGEKHWEIYLLSIRQDKGRSEPGYAHPTDNQLNYLEFTLTVVATEKNPDTVLLRATENKFNLVN